MQGKTVKHKEWGGGGGTHEAMPKMVKGAREREGSKQAQGGGGGGTHEAMPKMVRVKSVTATRKNSRMGPSSGRPWQHRGGGGQGGGEGALGGRQSGQATTCRVVMERP